jgi:hypothetical protein
VTAKEDKAVAEEQRRQQASVTDLAREEGMVDEKYVPTNPDPKKTEKESK